MYLSVTVIEPSSVWKHHSSSKSLRDIATAMNAGDSAKSGIFKSLSVCSSPCIEAEEYMTGVPSNEGGILVGGIWWEIEIMFENSVPDIRIRCFLDIK